MVHCAAGLGIAVTILACYFIKYQNYSAKDSIEKAGGKIEEIKPKDKVEKKELKNEDTDK